MKASEVGSVYIQYILSAAVLLMALIAIEPALGEFASGLLTKVSYVLGVPIY